MKKSISLMTVVMFGFLSVAPMPGMVWAQDSAAGEVMNMIVGDIETIDASNLTRVSVTNPEIADVSDTKNDVVSIVGKKAGQTTVFVWDDEGKRAVSVHVSAENLDTLKSRIKDVLDKSGIKGISLESSDTEGKVILSGSLSKDDKKVFEKAISSYSDGIINLVKEEVNDDLVQVDIQVAEVNSTFEKDLGVDWNTRTGSNLVDGANVNYDETNVPATGKVKDWFKFGDFNRSSQFNFALNALVKDDKARILSKPRLVVVSGKEASFLVGGEIPIRTTTTSASGGSSQDNVEFKKYGIDMTVTPVIRDGKVDIALKIEISQPDDAHKVVNDVAFLTRTVQTQLFLDNNQTIVMAGLIKHNDAVSKKRIPFLSRIPIAGVLFRKTSTGSTPDQDTELVVALTPRILSKKEYAKDQTVLPSKRVKEFTESIEKNYEKEPLESGAVAPKENIIKDASVSQKTESKAMPMRPAPVLRPSPPMNPYVRSIQMKISQQISYPYEALENNWEGTVKLRLQILKDGTLANATVVESSGHDIFDKDALNTAKIVAPYESFPSSMENDEDLVVTVPIVYSHGNLTKNSTETVVSSY